MTSSLFTPLAASLALLASMCGSAHASIASFGSAASFAEASALPATDGFNALPLDFIPGPLARSAGGYSYSVDASGGLYGTGSAADTWLSTSLSGMTMTFGAFGGGVRAIGGNFFATDITGFLLEGATVTLTATDADGATATHLLTNALPSSFAGFVSTAALVSLTVEVDSMGAWATANNLVAAVPEPGTYLLMLAGITALVALHKRRPAG
ncbi:PEP-CTERM sorting domain-containing protein [Aquincola sp. MAHUQ-54]|uniref:PEP-CTERM sorting domain-containing protein n=1 Tax=Aquincola agrisoli TaxID=3119538 RepID=A0AAW9QF26_9BURK